jgi:hypothetical protein
MASARAYRRHLPRRERNVLVKVGIGDLILLSDIRSDERARTLSNNVIVGDVATRELQSTVRLQRPRQLLAVDEHPIAFCCLCY